MEAINYILFDPPGHKDLLPLAFTRAVADFRIGIFTIKDKWEFFLDKTAEVLTRDYLQPLYGLDEIAGAHNFYINGSVLPDEKLVAAITRLKAGQGIYSADICIAFCDEVFYRNLREVHEHKDADQSLHYSGDVRRLAHSWDIFKLNGGQIIQDIEHIAISGNGITARNALAVNDPENVYIEAGARIESAIINASTGPVYIGKGAHIMDGAMIRGPVAICDHAVVKMGAKIYPDTTIGPYCKVGGEVGESVLFGYSNKGHDGYLGNSVIGQWCNLGADTNTSNLKNNYGPVKCWSYSDEDFVDTGMTFCGLIMGDHSRSGINTMFNTGTVAGVAANIFGGGFPPKFIPSFSWGGHLGGTEFTIEKVFEMAGRMMSRRNEPFTETHRAVLKRVFEDTRQFRKQ